MVAPFPHCDSLVLHAPGTCRYCDKYPIAQQKRVENGVNFTGQTDATKVPCPSLSRRSLDTIEKWPGNRAYPEEESS